MATHVIYPWAVPAEAWRPAPSSVNACRFRVLELSDLGFWGFRVFGFRIWGLRALGF